MGLSHQRALVYDKGLFVDLAERLARDFGAVQYFSPWEGMFPHPRDVAIGEGLENVERVYNFWDAVDAADVIVFPDVGDGDLQEFLRNRNYRVWGSGGAQWLELDRLASRKAMAEVNIDTPETYRVVGIRELRKFLAGKEDLWVKISLFRGAFETFHHVNDFISSSWLDAMEHKLGAQANHLEYLIEESVPGVELGWDAHSIDGQFPKLGFYGLEVKDCGLLGVMKEFSSLPQEVQDVYTRLGPALSEGQYRNYLSVEMRLDKKGDKPTVIDPCCRFGSPCSEGWMELVGNLSEIVWEGAAGNLVEVQPTAAYAALAVISSEWALNNWTPIRIPKEIQRWVKMSCCTVIDGCHYYIPGTREMAEFGVVVGVGNTLDAAIEMCEENAKQIEGHKLDIKTDALREGQEAMEQSATIGISFDAPSPLEIVHVP